MIQLVIGHAHLPILTTLPNTQQNLKEPTTLKITQRKTETTLQPPIHKTNVSETTHQHSIHQHNFQ